jgi:hypothetical protein
MGVKSEHWLGALENRVLRKILELKGKEHEAK